MTDIAKELLENISEGIHVSINYGTSDNQKYVEGTIEKISEYTLTIRKDDGLQATIILDDLRAINEIPQNEIRSMDQGAETISQSSRLLNTDTEDGLEKAPESAVENIETPEVTRTRVPLKEESPYSFKYEEWKNLIGQNIDQLNTSKFKHAMQRHLKSMNSAIKNHTVVERRHNLFKAISTSQKNCSSQQELYVSTLMLGVLSVITEDFNQARLYLLWTHQFRLASYTASKGGHSAEAEIYLIFALLSKEKDSTINKSISNICIKQKDSKVISRLLDIYSDDKDVCELLFSCTYELLIHSNVVPPKNITNHDSARTAALKLIDCLPDDYKDESQILKQWESLLTLSSIPDSFQRVIDADNTLVQTGNIDQYLHRKKSGHIKCEGSEMEKGLYFSIAQVKDDTDSAVLLRKLLYLGYSEGLNVSFVLGKDSNGSTVATDIDLTLLGYQTAQLRAISVNMPSFVYYGHVVRYNNNKKDLDKYKGVIESCGEVYNFRLRDVADPYLKKFYEIHYHSKGQSVTFKIERDHAVEICWDAIDHKSHDFMSVCQKVDNKEAEEWNDFKKIKDQNLSINKLPSGDPYKKEKFISLPHKALTKAEMQKYYVNQAKKCRDNNDFEAAENLYEKALAAGGFSEKIVNSLISTYLRDNKTYSALETFNQFKNKYSAESALNTEKQIYEKAKDYEALCPLYEKAYKTATTLSSKSHNLNRLINAYINLGEYGTALEACHQWETLYRQNQFSREAERLKVAVSDNARFKAICCYNLGQQDEAQKIATDLIQSNPSDKTALAILEDRLDKKLPAEAANKTNDDPDDGLYDDSNDLQLLSDLEENDNTIKDLSCFVRDRILDTKISEFLDASHIDETGRYIGTLQDAKKDVNSLIARSRKMSAGEQSECLFAACHLIIICGLQPNNLLRLSGRAASLYSNYMVIQSSDTASMDCARMGYLYAIKVLKPQRKGKEDTFWAISFNCFIRSFFEGQEALKTYINQQMVIKEKSSVDTKILEEDLPNPVISSFVVGMMQLCDALNGQTDTQGKLLQDLYERNPELRESIIQDLNQTYGIKVQKSYSQSQFEEAFLKGCDIRKSKMDFLKNEFKALTDDFMTTCLTGDKIDIFDPEKWKPWLNNTDKDRVGQIHTILSSLQVYFKQGATFEVLEDSITRAINSMVDLVNNIRKAPTELSYETFLPSMDQIMVPKLMETRDKLYENYQPVLDWSQSIQPYRMPNGYVQIQLLVSNKVNYQTAYSLNIRGVSGDIQKPDIQCASQNVRGGEEKEFGFSVKLNDDANQSGSFSLSVWYAYKYSESSDSPQQEKTGSYTETFFIHDEEFEEFKDPFIYRGGVVKDPKMFYGRDEDIEDIVRQIISRDRGEMNYHQAIAMYGQTRTGKSSILYHLKDKLKKDYGDRILIWDIGDVGIIDPQDGQDYLNCFLRYMLDIGENEIRRHQRIKNIVSEAGLVCPIEDMRKFPEQTGELFTSYMRQLSFVLEDNQCMIVLLVDEFTYLYGRIKDGKLSVDFMKFWKAMLQNYAIFSVVVGTDNMPEFKHNYPNEFACMVLKEVSYLDEKYAKKLIEEPLARENNGRTFFKEDGTVDEIYELTAGSAFLTANLCSELVKYTNEKTIYQITKGSFDDFLNKRAFGGASFLDETRFESQLKEKGHEELDDFNREILVSIALNSQAKGYATVEEISCNGCDPEEIQRLLDRLVERRVLKREKQGYYIWVKLLEKWLIWRGN